MTGQELSLPAPKTVFLLLPWLDGEKPQIPKVRTLWDVYWGKCVWGRLVVFIIDPGNNPPCLPVSSLGICLVPGLL